MLGGRLATALVATISIIFFIFLIFFLNFPSRTFFMFFKKLFSRKLFEMPNNLEVHSVAILGPQVAILDFAVGAALQAVSKLPRRN